jgi:CTP-dependent riboflavin kinase
MEKEIVLSGRVVTGLGQGASFTQLPWARKGFTERVGVDPYPGTLNLRLEKPEHLAAWRALREEPGIPIPPPSQDFCSAKCFRVMVEDKIAGAIVYPLVPGYPEDTLEIIAPVHLKSSLGVEDGALVRVRIIPA